jgi:hypothetical protein
MLAVAVLGRRYGHPARLLFGVDYERNTCAVDNTSPHRLRFNETRADDFPYEVLYKTAVFDDAMTSTQLDTIRSTLPFPMYTGTRDFSAASSGAGTLSGGTDGGGSSAWYHPTAGSRALLYYADPASRLAVCVSDCPAPPAVSDGLSTRVCSYNAPNTQAPLPPPSLMTNSSEPWCVPTYRTAALAGYCIPTTVDTPQSYNTSGLPFSATQLLQLRADLTSRDNRRYFAAAVRRQAAHPPYPPCHPSHPQQWATSLTTRSRARSRSRWAT